MSKFAPDTDEATLAEDLRRLLGNPLWFRCMLGARLYDERIVELRAALSSPAIPRDH